MTTSATPPVDSGGTTFNTPPTVPNPPPALPTAHTFAHVTASTMPKSSPFLVLSTNFIASASTNLITLIEFLLLMIDDVKIMAEVTTSNMFDMLDEIDRVEYRIRRIDKKISM
ncbi:hypothetical protein ABFS82_10G112900 [Erythranthe guttata]